MESLIINKIPEYSLNNSFLSNTQHGFRKSMSTVTNLVELLDNVTNNLDLGNCIDVITIDFSKAFDTISHNKLLHKLNNYGIVGNVHGWLKDFLCGRSFSVCFGSTMSGTYNVESSVPQGSRLGPLMYILYANDLSDLFTFAKVIMYADDLTIYAVINSEADRILLQNDLIKLCNWAIKWDLSINYDKCKLIHFGYNNKIFSYDLNGNIIHSSSCEKILGVFIDCKLSFDQHIYSCIKKLQMSVI
jgi:hypothetical protein